MGAVVVTCPSSHGRVAQMLGLAAEALPEKYVENGEFNQAFGWHLTHYVRNIGNPPAGGGALKRFIEKNLEAMTEQCYNNLCMEMESLRSLRTAEDEASAIEAISLQTGTNHRSLVAGLKTMKPDMVAEAVRYFREHATEQRVAA